mmetsp:Transcript_27922/g.34458  ORF Transcript_27922/g.34458 Transcript_27922/m.34458 type:complete len:145 (-) Transcript_27922:86-520(-)
MLFFKTFAESPNVQSVPGSPGFITSNFHTKSHHQGRPSASGSISGELGDSASIVFFSIFSVFSSSTVANNLVEKDPTTFPVVEYVCEPTTGANPKQLVARFDSNINVTALDNFIFQNDDFWLMNNIQIIYLYLSTFSNAWYNQR